MNYNLVTLSCANASFKFFKSIFIKNWTFKTKGVFSLPPLDIETLIFKNTLDYPSNHLNPSFYSLQNNKLGRLWPDRPWKWRSFTVAQSYLLYPELWAQDSSCIWSVWPLTPTWTTKSKGFQQSGTWNIWIINM